jgi:ATP-dependent helicase HrpA
MDESAGRSTSEPRETSRSPGRSEGRRGSASYATLRALIERCRTRDRAPFFRRLQALERQRRAGGGPGAASAGGAAQADESRVAKARGNRTRDARPIDAAALEEQIRASVAWVEERRAKRPTIKYPADLPVVERREDILAAIRDHQVVVICGETGSGKTTQLPKLCLELGRGCAGLIGHTQPRRIAARSVAQRIADELGTPVGANGAAVGYKVRFADKTGPEAYIKLMTDGILLAETQADRGLNAYDTIIIDEAHERSLNIDFLLGYLKSLLPRRPDLKVIITSATIDPERFAAHFAGPAGPAPIINVSGRTYPVEVRYRPGEPDPETGDTPTQARQVVSAVAELWQGRTGRDAGDVLVFLSGEREIRQAAKALRDHFVGPHAHGHGGRGTEILPLYARLSNAEQNRIFARTDDRRIVLATNVAETSLTVPGIRYVVDTGEARLSRYNPRAKVQGLQIEPISQASANQRAGRCGRLGPGVCVRLYAEDDFQQREAFTPPEILRTNLAAVILQMRALDLGDIESFPFIDRPDSRMIRDGFETLRELGAIDEENTLTPLGREMARLPIDPRLARMILAAREEHCLAEMLVIASALSIQDPRERPMDKAELADVAHLAFRHAESDFLSYVKLWNTYLKKKEGLSNAGLRRWCAENFLNVMRMREWQDVHRQLAQLASEMKIAANPKPAGYDEVHRALLSGLLSNIGTKTSSFEYDGARGLKFSIFPGSALFSAKPKWCVAAEIVRTTRVYARTVARAEPEWIERVGAHLLQRRYGDPYWHEGGEYVAAPMTLSLYGLELATHRKANYANIDRAAARKIFIHHALVEGQMKRPPAFLSHNQRLVERVEQIEAKVRRRDLLVAAEERFDFYDARIPAHITSTAEFEKWRRTALQANPRLLHMREEDLLAEKDALPGEQAYPDEVVVGGISCPVSYVHDPTSADDGAVLTVPIDALVSLDEKRLPWLVPGLFAPRIEAIIRMLPKELRRLLSPASESARRAADMLNRALRDDRQPPFAGAAAAALGAIAGQSVDPSMWNPAELPAHVQVKVRVVDEQGTVLAEGRELGPIKRGLTARLRNQFMVIPHPRLNRDSIIEWDFGDLPRSVEIEHNGIHLTAYPAIVDEGPNDGTGIEHRAAVRLLEARDPARLALRKGLRRLFAVHMQRFMKFRYEDHGQLVRAATAYPYVGSKAEIRDQLTLLIAERAFLFEGHTPVDADTIRSAAAYEARLDAGWNRVSSATKEIAAMANTLLDAQHEFLVRVDRERGAVYADAMADLRRWHGRLAPRAFLAETPLPWLMQFARYFCAAVVRLDKLVVRGVEKDNQHARYLEQLWEAYAYKAERNRRASLSDQALEDFRWMLEEMRVSLYAESLGTAVPVSPKRLEAQWGRVLT